MEFTIDSRDRVIIGGVSYGNFSRLQRVIQKERPDLVQLHKIKAIYNGNAEFRFIADWELIIKTYYEIEDHGSEG